MEDFITQFKDANALWVWQTISFLFILLLTFIAVKLSKQIFERTFIHSSLLKDSDITNVRFLSHFVRAVIIIVGLGSESPTVTVALYEKI